MGAVEAEPARREVHATVLASAFAEDPVLSWAFPDRRTRERYGRRFFRHTLRRLQPDGLTWTAGDDAAVAVWAAPGHWAVSVLDLVRMADLAGGVGWRLPRVGLGLAGIEARHPETPHAYLACVGVVPDRQGRGLGSAVMGPGLEWADARGLPAYLESSNERNVPLYERHGFRVTKVIRLPGGPPVWLMWRAAQV